MLAPTSSPPPPSPERRLHTLGTHLPLLVTITVMLAGLGLAKMPKWPWVVRLQLASSGAWRRTRRVFWACRPGAVVMQHRRPEMRSDRTARIDGGRWKQRAARPSVYQSASRAQPASQPASKQC
ncbi:hypothetical protein GGR56DRAFT_618214 [Xylariaceae sp. FL0804]|nr:hypothetical protein GGR56DRAFT_618214 [Xylariaceae sp. FL0804]